MQTFSHEYFQNKIVWLIGASSGIGAGLGLQLAAAGARVIVSARNKAALEALPASVEVLDFDLAVPEQRASAVGRIQALTDRIDIFIYCAGVTQRAKALETTLPTVRSIMEVNFFGAVDLTTRLFQSHLLQNNAQLVIFSSVLGYVGTPKRSTYAASKHALHGYFDSLRAELHEKRIAITMICPGYVATGIDNRAITADGQLQKQADGNRPRGLQTDAFVRLALRAMAARRAEAYIGGGEMLGIYLQRWMPGFVYRNAHKFAPEMARDWTAHQFLSTPAFTLHYRLSSRQTNKRILLIPGLSSPLEVFHRLIPQLESAGYEVLSLDLPGRGLSVASDSDQTMKGLGRWLEALVEHVGWQESSWDVLGFSWGVGLASWFAGRHASKVKRLMLLAPVGLRRSVPWGASFASLPGLNRLFGRRGLIQDFKRGFEDEGQHTAFIQLFIQQSRKPDFSQALRQSLRLVGFDFEKIFQNLSACTFSVQVLAAEDDPKLHPDFIRTLQTWIPRVQTKILPRGRHMLPLENPTAIVDALLKF